MKRYLTQFLLSAATFFAAFGAINWVVDPYWIYGSPQIKHFNSIKPLIYEHPRLFKTNNVLHYPPEAIVLGTSREDAGIDPKHEAFRGLRAFNCAIPGQPYFEANKILETLASNNTFPKLIVFGAIFEHSNPYFHGVIPDYTEENYNKLYRYRLLLSLSTLEASAKTVIKNQYINKRSLRDGFRPPEYWEDVHGFGMHRLIYETTHQTLVQEQLPLPAFKQVLSAAGVSPIPMEEVREMVALAYREKSNMKIFIGPSHALQWETIWVNGIWPVFEAWKRELVDIVESEAVKAHATPFQVWDFSGYNSITTEEVPPVGDIKTPMHNYYDSSHYTPDIGRLVLDRIFNLEVPGRKVPDDFGVLMTSKNIEEHLADIRRQHEQYSRTHPENVAELVAMAKEVNEYKHKWLAEKGQVGSH